MSGGHCFTVIRAPPLCLCFQCNVADVHVANGNAHCLLPFPRMHFKCALSIIGVIVYDDVKEVEGVRQYLCE